MTKFKIKKDSFKKFLEATACEGIIKFKDKSTLKQPLFSTFFLIVKGNSIEVLTIDTIKKTIMIDNIIEDVEVIEEGQICVSDYESILSVLKGKGLGKNPTITVYDEGIVLKIETDNDDDGYEIRQRESEDTKKVSQKFKYLKGWKKAHQENENGIIIASAKDPKTKEIVKVPFSMKIVVNKDDFLKVVDDAVNLTKDNKTKITHQGNTLKAFKGDANAKTKGKHKIPYDDIGEKVFDFEHDFYNVQTIFPNLFDKITLNIRKVESDGSLAVWIKSIDEKNKITINMAITSIKG